MNALEHIARHAAMRAHVTSGSLRARMYEREGVDQTEDAIRRGLRAFAVERATAFGPRDPETVIVFGKCASDAIRRACAPARLGEAIDGDTFRTAPIESGWDEPVVWPLDIEDAA